MEREKRQIKAPQVYEIPKVCYPRIRKRKPKSKPPQEAQYQVIPAPMKFVYTANFFALYGDIGLRQYQGTLNTDTGILNQYLDFRGVEIRKKKEFNVVYLTVEKKFHVPLPAWQHLVSTLEDSESPELRGWGARIKSFSLSHEEAYRTLSSDEVIINGYNEQELLKITEDSQKKITRLLQEYPCIIFTSTTEKNTAKVRDMTFNEQYLNEIGYSLESFAATILQEGIPRMMPNNTACCAKILIDNYYTLGKGGIETPEIISDLNIKNGYMRKVRYKMIYLPSYRNRAYDVSAVLVILGREQSISKEDSSENCEINKRFLKKIIKKEKDTTKFMQKYYDMTLNLPYMNRNKICKIKELDVKNEDYDWVYEEEA